MIATHNANPHASHSLALNQFADLTRDEFRAKYLGYHMAPRPGSRRASRRGGVTTAPARVVRATANASLADAVDWRSAGAVTDVTHPGSWSACDGKPEA